MSGDKFNNEPYFVTYDRNATVIDDKHDFFLCHIMHLLFRGPQHSKKKKQNYKSIDFFEGNFRF